MKLNGAKVYENTMKLRGNNENIKYYSTNPIVSGMMKLPIIFSTPHAS